MHFFITKDHFFCTVLLKKKSSIDRATVFCLYLEDCFSERALEGLPYPVIIRISYTFLGLVV